MRDLETEWESLKWKETKFAAPPGLIGSLMPEREECEETLELGAQEPGRRGCDEPERNFADGRAPRRGGLGWPAAPSSRCWYAGGPPSEDWSSGSARAHGRGPSSGSHVGLVGKRLLMCLSITFPHNPVRKVCVPLVF